MCISIKFSLLLLLQKYSKLVKELKDHYKSVIFINISMSCLGVFANESRSLLTMFDKTGFDKKQQDFCVKRMTTIAIRTTYFIFCSRNKEWGNPTLYLINVFVMIQVAGYKLPIC